MGCLVIRQPVCINEIKKGVRKRDADLPFGE